MSNNNTIKSEIARQILAFLAKNGVNLEETVHINADDDVVEIIFVDDDPQIGLHLIGMFIEQDDSGWTVMVKKTANINALNKNAAFEYVNKLNSEIPYITSYVMIDEDESGYVAKIDRDSNVPAELMTDLNELRKFVRQYFNQN